MRVKLTEPKIQKIKSFGFSFETGEQPGTIIGYGSVFGNIDSYGEIVDKGAFKNLSSKKSYPFLWQHMSSRPIGVWDEFYEDETGLRMKGRLLIDDIDLAREAYALIKAGAVTGLSIGYIVNEYAVDKENNVHLTDIELMEVSLVTFPANQLAGVTEVKNSLTIRDAEHALVDAGFSHRQAKQILAKGFKDGTVCDEQQSQRDAETELKAEKGSEILDRLRKLQSIFEDHKNG